jgi:hypothetical protein
VLSSLRGAKQLIASAPTRIATRRNWRRLVAFLILSLLGLLTLAALDLVESKGLWGDFVFAFIVTSVVIALAGHAISDERWERWDIMPPTTLYAPFWALFILLDIPLAIVSRWSGFIVLSIVLAILWIALPSIRLAVALTTAAMLLFVGLLSAFTGAQQPAVSDAVSLRRADATAHRYRPILLFDGNEAYAPVDIGRAIAERHVRACHRTIIADRCPTIESSSDIDSDVEFLEVKANTLGPADSTGGADSAIYYHAVERTDPPRVYLDYWWFFTQNPEPVLSGLLCRAGLHLGEITCFQHEADWEGITVVLAPCTFKQEIGTACVSLGKLRLHLIAVAYAEHGGPARQFGWNTLEQLWTNARAPTDGERPIVYVALNSHAAYPRRCPPKCGREESNNGRAPWGNNGATCVTAANDCVQELPIDAAGKPTSWNAFPGPWGAQHCILDGAYCDGGPAPRGPALHSRYGQPDAVN